MEPCLKTVIIKLNFAGDMKNSFLNARFNYKFEQKNM